MLTSQLLLKRQLLEAALLTHAVVVLPGDCWGRFMNLPDGQNGPFEHFFITNSNPRITDKLPRDDCFQVLNPKP